VTAMRRLRPHPRDPLALLDTLGAAFLYDERTLELAVYRAARAVVLARVRARFAPAARRAA